MRGYEWMRYDAMMVIKIIFGYDMKTHRCGEEGVTIEGDDGYACRCCWFQTRCDEPFAATHGLKHMYN